MSRKTSKASALGSKLDQQSRDFDAVKPSQTNPGVNPATKEEYEAIIREATQPGMPCLVAGCPLPYEYIVFYGGQFPRNIALGVFIGVCQARE